MKLYIGGFRHIQGLTIAKNDTQAKNNITDKLNLKALPVEVEEIDMVDEFKINVFNPKDLPTTGKANKFTVTELWTREEDGSVTCKLLNIKPFEEPNKK